MNTRLLPLFLLTLTACDMGMLSVRQVEDGESTPITQYPNSPEPQNPILPSLLTHATFGERCVGGEVERYLVLSDSPSTCAEDAGRIDGTSSSDGFVAMPLIRADGANVVVYCKGEDCETTTMNFSSTLTATNIDGAWQASLNGKTHDVSFSGVACDYNAALPAGPVERHASGLSIREMSVYQGVKIPIIQDSAPATRNAPVVAGRPGLIRVFVDPQADWQPRQIRARLTLGDRVLEQTWAPTGASAETNFASTINFELEEGELLSGVDYTVELLEVDACGAPQGTVVNARFPEQGAAPLLSEAINPLRVVLVPIQYNADGTGRTPTLDQAAIDRFRNAMFKNYPVNMLDVSVRAPFPTDQGLAPNGSGFGPMLNICLNIRAQDNPDPDVYYYCLIQPSTSRDAFCGGGCVGGIAPLAPADSVSNRGGIGIAFNGVGEDIFVHEIGHAMGRPHAPCGGAAGTDPDFPDANGRIGTWGFDVTSNSLISPDAPDFMGYCDPAWVSTYTYNALFQRLKTVLGSQAYVTYTEPRLWKTAALETDGEFVWGNDMILEQMPSGTLEMATVYDAQGSPIATIEAFVTEISCDLDTVLITLEDPGPDAHMVQVGEHILTL